MLLNVTEGAALSDETLEALMTLSVVALEANRVVVFNGAGISTNAGIPDFRSGSTGLYATNRSRSPPSSASSRVGPATTATSASSTLSTKDLFSYPSLIHPNTRSDHLRFMAQLHAQCSMDDSSHPTAPTTFHALMKRLGDLDKLLRVYSQNVDGLEQSVGLSFVDLEGIESSASSLDDSACPMKSSDTDETSDYEDSTYRRARKRRKLSISPNRALDSPRGQVVAMHGNLRSVVCSSCRWKGEWDSSIQSSFARGERVDCPRCEERAQVRLSASKRSLPRSSLAFLRPNLLLYDDPSSTVSAHLSALSSLASLDVASKPDLLIVAGTSLQIPGFKQLVKEFAREVSANGGLCVFVNREPVAASWNEVFDYQFRMDTDLFATIVLQNLAALSPAHDEPSTNNDSVCLDSVDLCQTPTLRQARLGENPNNSAYLPTPSPTPSYASALSFFPAPCLEDKVEPRTSPAPTSCDLPREYLPSPPPTSSPLRTRAVPRRRPLKQDVSVSESTTLVPDKDEDEGCPVEKEYRPEKQAGSSYCHVESRLLVDSLLRQARTVWERSQR
ncbi:uncharacterized protein JCM15063_001652 [Sporobolomyces koalae]|uniref:uncharacterized protein n=1 Tax=Sporobolomyces koalae TaxID=500713 RepID=UPI0031778639